MSPVGQFASVACRAVRQCRLSDSSHAVTDAARVRQIVSASFRVVSAFVADVPSSADRLAALLRCAEVRSAVWRYTWRADCWPERLLPVLNAAAEELHSSVEIVSTQVSFARQAGLAPVDTFTRFVKPY